MALFEKEESSSRVKVDAEARRTEPAFTVPVKVRPMPQYGEGQKGVVALSPIPAGTKFWAWTERVLERIHYKELPAYLARMTKDIRDETERLEAKRVLLCPPIYNDGTYILHTHINYVKPLS